MPGPPAVAYYTACPLNRVQIRASLLVFFTAVTPVALVSAIVLGLLTLDSFVMAVLALPVMYAGQIVGQWAFKFGSDTAHKRVAIVCLALIALSAAVKGVSEFF
jgi:uncharacterized membrane protein YfcA